VVFGEDTDSKNVLAAEFAAIKERSRWRLNRLRCMTIPEISHRVFRMLAMHVERAGLIGSPRIPVPDLAPTPPAGSMLRRKSMPLPILPPPPA